MSDRCDGTGAPIIERLNAKIGTLERRIDHLASRLEAGTYRSSASADFDRVELAALRDAVRCMRYHRACLEADTDPRQAITRLVLAVMDHLAGNITDDALVSATKAAAGVADALA